MSLPGAMALAVVAPGFSYPEETMNALELKLKDLTERLGRDVVVAYDPRVGWWTVRRLTVEGGALGTGQNIEKAVDAARKRAGLENRFPRFACNEFSRAGATPDTSGGCVR